MTEISRRTLAKGAAWTVPPLVYTVAAQQVAASPPLPAVASPGSLNATNTKLMQVTGLMFSNVNGCSVALSASSGTGKAMTVTPGTVTGVTATTSINFTAKDAKDNGTVQYPVTVTALVTCGNTATRLDIVYGA